MHERVAVRGPAAGSLPILLAVVFVDMLGFSIILPLLPFYAETFGASPAVVGLLVASYAAAQLVGAPLLGGLSDRFGRRPVLVLSILGTAAGFVLFGLAGSLTVLFASRVIDGLTGGNISVAQAYVADVSEPAQRARNFGLIGAAFGLGFVIGPALGGFLSRWGYALPAFLAAGMATLNAVAVWIALPESLPAERRRGGATAAPRAGGRAATAEGAEDGTGRPQAAAGATTSRPPSAFRHLWAGDRAGGLLWLRFYFALAFVTFQTIFALWSQYHLGLDAEKTGYVLGYIGVLIVLVQGGLVGMVARRFREERVLVTCIVVMAGGLAAWAFAPNVPVLLVTLVPLAASGGVFRAVATSALSAAVAADEVGAALGAATSLESLTRALAPSIGGVLLEHYGTWAPGLFGTAVLVLLLPYAIGALRRPRPAGAQAGARADAEGRRTDPPAAEGGVGA
ncbi:MAG: MFS transporter [Gemmatimonadetes bacterium]|nr:MAG: MFS transporter [Gemmatimonadota bacterium]